MGCEEKKHHKHETLLFYSIYNLAKKNIPQAIQVLIENAENGIAEAQLALAKMYDKGNGVLKDHNKADNWFRLAAAQ